MKIAVLTECALSRKHGTGAQLLRILEKSNVEFFHVYLTHSWGGQSECDRSFRLEDPRWTGRGRRHIAKVERLLGLNWWNGDDVDTRKWQRLVDREKLQCDVAYVVVANESQALKFNSLLASMKVPYIVHVMDIYDDQGFNAHTMTGLARLFRGAMHNIALSEPIRIEIEKFGCKNVSIIPIGQDTTDKIATAPISGERINLLTVGKPYAEGTQLLAEAWPAIKKAVPGIRLIYAGQHTKLIPPELAADLDNRGYIADKQVYESLLAESHVAYLSGPSDLQMFGRFSIPSRTSDFLMAGLPVVAAVAEGSATAQFLKPLVPDAARFVAAAEQLIDSIRFFANDVDRWRFASAASHQFGVANVSMEQVRSKIIKALEESSGSKVGTVVS